MFVWIKPQNGYFNLTHLEGRWVGPPDPPESKCRINGSEFLTAKELGQVVQCLVACAREFGCDDFEYVDLYGRPL